MNALSLDESRQPTPNQQVIWNLSASFTGITSSILDDAVQGKTAWDERGFLLKMDLNQSSKRNKKYRRKGKFR